MNAPRKSQYNPIIECDLTNYTEPQLASFYLLVYNKENKQVRGKKLFSFNFIPLLVPEVRKNIMEFYDDPALISKLLFEMEFHYYALFYASLYSHTSKRINSSNLKGFIKSEIENFEKRDTDEYSDLIMPFIDENTLSNTNILENIRTVMYEAYRNKTSDIKVLLFGENYNPKSDENEPTKKGKQLFSSVTNIVYKNFLDFLKKQAKANQKEENNVKVANLENQSDGTDGQDLTKEIQSEQSNEKECARKEAVKTFPEYLLHVNNLQLAEKLKEEFKTEIGKSIRLLLLDLSNRGFLTLENRQQQKIYDSLRVFLGRHIGSYNSIFTSFYYIEKKHKPDLDAISLKVEFVLKNTNNTK